MLLLDHRYVTWIGSNLSRVPISVPELETYLCWKYRWLRPWSQIIFTTIYDITEQKHEPFSRDIQLQRQQNEIQTGRHVWSAGTQDGGVYKRQIFFVTGLS